MGGVPHAEAGTRQRGGHVRRAYQRGQRAAARCCLRGATSALRGRAGGSRSCVVCDGASFFRSRHWRDARHATRDVAWAARLTQRPEREAKLLGRAKPTEEEVAEAIAPCGLTRLACGYMTNSPLRVVRILTDATATTSVMKQKADGSHADQGHFGAMIRVHLIPVLISRLGPANVLVEPDPGLPVCGPALAQPPLSRLRS